MTATSGSQRLLARSPLHAVHESLGATFTEFAGWLMPLRYRSEIVEHHAVRTSAGIFDLTHMGQIEVRGPEASLALDYALVGDASAMAIHQARYTMICQPDGGILDDLVLYRLAADRFLVVANASNVDVVLEALGARANSYAARVRDRSADTALIAIQGPHAAQILAKLVGDEIQGLRYYTAFTGELATARVMIARTGYTGEDGFEIFCAAADAPQIWQTIVESDAQGQLLPAGLACRDSLRLEAGMPLYGHEISRRTTPYDAGLGRLVKLGQHDHFVGRSALVEHLRAGPARTLVGIVTSSPPSPRQGQRVLDQSGSSVIGEVTSGIPSPTLGHPIAMAYIETVLGAEGTKLVVDVRGRHLPARVVTLPFYRRPEVSQSAEHDR
jgi:aminomethyltransferase